MRKLTANLSLERVWYFLALPTNTVFVSFIGLKIVKVYRNPKLTDHPSSLPMLGLAFFSKCLSAGDYFFSDDGSNPVTILKRYFFKLQTPLRGFKIYSRVTYGDLYGQNKTFDLSARLMI